MQAFCEGRCTGVLLISSTLFPLLRQVAPLGVEVILPPLVPWSFFAL